MCSLAYSPSLSSRVRCDLGSGTAAITRDNWVVDRFHSEFARAEVPR